MLGEVHDQITYYIDSDLGALANNLADWKGPAAEEFADSFYFKYAKVQEAQIDFVRALIAAVAASRIITRSGKHSLMSNAVATRHVLRDQLQLRSVEQEQVSTKTVLMIAGAGASVLAAAALPALWGASLAAVNGALSVAASKIPEDLEEKSIKEIRGKKSSEIVTSLFDRTTEVIANTQLHLDFLQSELRDIGGMVEDLYQQRSILPARPSLVEGVRGDEFHHRSATQN